MIKFFVYSIDGSLRNFNTFCIVMGWLHFMSLHKIFHIDTQDINSVSILAVETIQILNMLVVMKLRTNISSISDKFLKS